MKKSLLTFTLITITLLNSGCATWEGVKKDTNDAWDATKETTNKAYKSTKKAIHDATE